VPDKPAGGQTALDDTVAAVTGTPTVQMEQVTVTIATTNRPVQIAYPLDMSDAELLEFVGWLSVQLRIHLAQRRAARPESRIVLPS
jgi:hypothetical protein